MKPGVPERFETEMVSASEVDCPGSNNCCEEHNKDYLAALTLVFNNFTSLPDVIPFKRGTKLTPCPFARLAVADLLRTLSCHS